MASQPDDDGGQPPSGPEQIDDGVDAGPRPPASWEAAVHDGKGAGGPSGTGGDGLTSGPEQIDDDAVGAGPPLSPAVLEAAADAAKRPGVEQIDDDGGPPLLWGQGPGDDPSSRTARSRPGVEQLDDDEDAPLPATALDDSALKKEAGSGVEAAGDDAHPNSFQFNPDLFENRMGRKMAAEGQGGESNASTGQHAADGTESNNIEASENLPRAQPADEEAASRQSDHSDDRREGNTTNEEAHAADPNEQGEAEISVPEAFLVEEESDIFIDAVAEPLLPWWKQRRTRILFAVVIVVVLTAAISIGVTTSADRTVTTTEVVAFSSAPSMSVAPSLSVVPSAAPTSCWFKMSQTPGTFERPLDDPSYQQFRVDGRNAVIAARRLTGSVQVAFYSLDDDEGWVQTSSFVEEYRARNKALRQAGPFRPAESGFHVSLSGSTAVLGLSRYDTDAGTGSGVIYVYVQDASSGLWTKEETPLLPSDGGEQDAQFGYSNGVHDGLVAACSFNEEALRIFQRNGNGWDETAKLDLSYSPFFCWIRHSSIVVADMDQNMVHFYQYDRDSSKLVTLQDPLVINPGIEGYDSWTDQFVATGTSKQITDILVSGDYLVFTTSSFAMAWSTESVSLYKRAEDDFYSLVQRFYASDYTNEGSAIKFGSEAAQDDDILVIGGEGRTWIFDNQNGTFEEALVLEESFDESWISGRTLIVARSGAELTSFSLEECLPTRRMSTQAPTSSLAPSTLSTSPSHSPTLSYVPSQSRPPSLAPTSSSAPTVCHVVQLLIQTCDDPSIFEGGAATWDLYEKQSEGAIHQSEPLEANQTYTETFPCVQAGYFTFNITNNAGLGFGLCDRGGYYITVDGDGVGGNALGFWDNEVMHFPVPYIRDERDAGKDIALCNFDFSLTVVTEEIPYDITWILADENGDTVLQGGPHEYRKPLGIFSEFACLDDGKYNFTIFNLDWIDTSSQGDWIGGYALTTNGSQVLAYHEGQIKSSDSTIFVTGTYTESSTNIPTGPMSSPPTAAPNQIGLDLSLSNQSGDASSACSKVQINVLFDNAPFGKGWVLTLVESGVSVESFFALDNDSLANQLYSQTLCLAPGRYKWTIYDSLGNGLCCDNGVGAYVLTTDGTTIAQGAIFQYSEEVLFHLPMEMI